MQVILSRKGFDSEYGGQPSPILEDGTLLSLPIPLPDEPHFYKQLRFQDRTYLDLIKELRPVTILNDRSTCHLDPDIRDNVLPSRKAGWRGLFGQSDAALGHLVNESISRDDLFLFFGWFKQVELVDNRYRYVRGAPDLHLIYGYLQVANRYEAAESIPEYARYHAHFGYMASGKTNEALFEARDSLSFAKDVPGYGCLTYNSDRVLTKSGYSRSRWHLPDEFKELTISYHTKKSFKDQYFQSAAKGQEFVIQEGDKILDWVKKVLGVNN